MQLGSGAAVAVAKAADAALIQTLAWELPYAAGLLLNKKKKKKKKERKKKKKKRLFSMKSLYLA